jgi:hypothetical protein
MDDTQSIRIECPVCHRSSDRIKQYVQYKLVVFLLFARYTQTATYTACPSCMRKMIGKSMLINLIPANLAWPVLAIVWVGQLAGTFTRGHSRQILDSIELGRMASEGGAPSAAFVSRSRRDLLVRIPIVAFLVGLFAAAGYVKEFFYSAGYWINTSVGEYTLVSDQTILLALAIPQANGVLSKPITPLTS